MTKRSKSEWRNLFKEHETSGLSAAAFCRQHDVNAKYFSLRKRQLTTSSSTSFIQIKPVVDQPANPAPEVSLRIIDTAVPLECLVDTLTSLLVRAR